MADISLTVTLPDLEALAIIVASLGPEQFEQAYHHWLDHWKAHAAYSPQVEANMVEITGEAGGKLHVAFVEAEIDVLSRLGPK